MRVPGTACRRDERGAVAVVAAFSMVVLFVLAALVVELGLARDVDLQAQTAADASALAAANAIYLTTVEPDTPAAVAAAKSSASANLQVTEAEWASCTDPDRPAQFDPIGGDCISMRTVRDTQNRPIETYLRVRIPTQNVKTPFASLAGVTSVNVGAAAEVVATRSARATCGVCILGAGTHRLQNGNLTAKDTGVHFNGSVDLGANGNVSATDLDTTDFYDVKITVQGTITNPTHWSPAPVTASPTLVDPLGFLKMPFDWTTLPVMGSTSPCTGGPGRYDNFSSFGTNCVLTPGLYVIAGEWSLSGQEAVTAEGSTLYFVCGTAAAPRACNANGGVGEPGGWLNAAGQGGLRISAPTSGPLQGLSIAYERWNTSDLVFKGNGGGSSGTIYALNSKFVYNGNGGGDGMDSLIVAGDLGFSGTNAGLETRYSPDKNVPLPADLHLTR